MRGFSPKLLYATLISKSTERNLHSIAKCVEGATLVCALGLALVCPALAQSKLLTSRGGNGRTAANTD